MDKIVTSLEHLSVSSDLFKDVKFYVTGIVPEKVINLLTDGGGKQESHITDFMTHLITGENPDEIEVGEVKELYEKPAVAHTWVIFSAKCGKLLPVRAFSPDSNQLFSGVKACLTHLGKVDSLSIWALISFHGGSCTFDLDHTCTHLICAKPEGNKYNVALKHEEQIKIVTPDWVTESVEDNERLEEIYYHPRLLKQPKKEENEKKENKKNKKKQEKEKQKIAAKKEEAMKQEELKELEMKKEAEMKREEEKKAIFSKLDFSDDEDEDSGKGSNSSLLTQLKSQTWKQNKPTRSSNRTAGENKLEATTTQSPATHESPPILEPQPTRESPATRASKIPAAAPASPNSPPTISTEQQPLAPPTAPIVTAAPSIPTTNTNTEPESPIPVSGANMPPQGMQALAQALNNPQGQTPRAPFQGQMQGPRPLVKGFLQRTASTQGQGSPVAGPMSAVGGPQTRSPAPVFGRDSPGSGPIAVGNIQAHRQSPQNAMAGPNGSTQGLQSSPQIPPQSPSSQIPQSPQGQMPASPQLPQSPGTPGHTTLGGFNQQVHQISQGMQGGVPNQAVLHQQQQQQQQQQQLVSGSQGNLGPSPQGIRGPQTGPQGIQGPQTGLITGPQGIHRQQTGPQSIQGLQSGPQGLQGPQAGSQGLQGQQTGPQGLQGQQTGPQGIQGPQTGPQGIQGQTGPQGLLHGPQNGPQGIQGQTGPQGLHGPQNGPQGLHGPQNGPQGLHGPQNGPQGIQGPQTGPQAIQGASPQSIQGVQTVVQQGPPGTPSPHGVQGQGPQGQPIPIGQSGMIPGGAPQQGSVIYQGQQQQPGGITGSPVGGNQGTLIRGTSPGGTQSMQQIVQQQQGGPRTLVPTSVVGPGGIRAANMPSTAIGQHNAGVRAPGAQGGPTNIHSQNMPNTIPQQVHSVAIPGAVVRLPQGVTPQQLQSMTPQQRHQFLQQLHQKQLAEQAAKGKPRPGQPQQVRYVSPGQLIRSSTPPGQPGQPPQPGQPGWQGGQVSQSGQVVSYTPGQVRTVTAAEGQQITTSGGQVVRPGWAPGQPGQPGQQYPPGTTRVVVGQPPPGWAQQQQQQAGGGIRQQLAPGQQITTSGGQPPPQGINPQHMQQLQLQIQQLCQHFPYLTPQDAQQLIQRIPGHFRHIQQLDNAQRSEYLGTLDPKERQVVTYFYVKKREQQMVQRQQALQQQQQQQAAAAAHQQKVAVSQHSPHGWQPGQQPPPGQPGGPYPPLSSPHGGRPIPAGGRPLPAGYVPGQPGGQVVSPGQGSPHLVAAGPQGGPGSEQVLLYQRRTLSNITGSITNNLIRPSAPGAGGPGYPRQGAPQHPVGPSPVMAPAAPHYPRPHLFGHDTNTMLPRELCLVGCVFYIADYHAETTPDTLQTWKRSIEQHGGEVVELYDSGRVTHLLCKHQKSPVFMQAVRENKRCITIFWLNDVLLRGKMAPPWQAIHLPTPYGPDNKPCKDLMVSVSGFENEERTIIKLMLQLVGAKYTGCFSKHNNLLICKKLEGAKVAKSREWKKPVVNGVWLSEVLLGQNTPPLVYHGTRYQHYLDDPLRIDPSLASHLFNSWKYPISVSKESVEKAKSVREKAMRKRKTEAEGDQENKRARLDPPSMQQGVGGQTGGGGGQQQSNGPQLPSMGTPGAFRGPLTIINKELPPEHLKPRVLLSSVRNKEEIERKILELGGLLARTSGEATHLVMGSNTAQRTVKFMCCLSTCAHILSLSWILESHDAQKFLPEEDFVIEMTEWEQVFSFSLKDTLKIKNRRYLLQGKMFYLTNSVVPGRIWLREIIECAGGTVENKRRNLKEIKELNKSDSHKYIVIADTSDFHLVKDLLEDDQPVYSPEFVLGAIMTQRIDYTIATYVLEE